jgi:hypothetical protein
LGPESCQIKAENKVAVSPVYDCTTDGPKCGP